MKEEYEEEQYEQRPVKKSNNLPVWGNEKTMNLNPLILTNIQSSQYFKVNLYKLKTYHEVLDEIYYQVNHLEPWEKGSRKTSGQTGMCGGVRGVGAGGIVSTAFCILYKLFTLRLTRKQVLGLMNHADSPYIRGLGFMYIRFTQPPADLWDWFEDYLDDEEEIDVRAGGGQTSTIGTVARHMLTKLDWHSTLFPRIPVPIQKDIEKRMSDRAPVRNTNYDREPENGNRGRDATNGDRWNKNNDERNKNNDDRNNERDRYRAARDKDRHSRDKDLHSRDNDRHGRDNDRHSRDNDRHSRDNDRHSRDKDRHSRNEDRYSRNEDRHSKNEDHSSRDKDRHNRDKDRQSKDRDRHSRKKHSRDGSRDRERHHHHHRKYQDDFTRELEREKERVKKNKRQSRSRSRSRDRRRRDH